MRYPSSSIRVKDDFQTAAAVTAPSSSGDFAYGVSHWDVAVDNILDNPGDEHYKAFNLPMSYFAHSPSNALTWIVGSDNIGSNTEPNVLQVNQQGTVFVTMQAAFSNNPMVDEFMYDVLAASVGGNYIEFTEIGVAYSIPPQSALFEMTDEVGQGYFQPVNKMVCSYPVYPDDEIRFWAGTMRDSSPLEYYIMAEFFERNVYEDGYWGTVSG